MVPDTLLYGVPEMMDTPPILNDYAFIMQQTLTEEQFALLPVFIFFPAWYGYCQQLFQVLWSASGRG